ncbi:MAG: hypothetical protein ACK504_03200 [Bacteroidota bacterium]|jgi:hypothetical protein
MKNNNVNKPLSSIKFFDLIEDNSSQNAIEENLDDFDKEALEGFKKHSSLLNAKKVDAEINLAITKKINQFNRTRKGKLIWFSAAASIALIITLSLFYFKDFKNQTENNIVLNENIKSQDQKNEESLEKIEGQSSIEINKPKQNAEVMLKKKEDITNRSATAKKLEQPKITNEFDIINALSKRSSESEKVASSEPVEQKIDKQQYESTIKESADVALENMNKRKGNENQFFKEQPIAKNEEEVADQKASSADQSIHYKPSAIDGVKINSDAEAYYLGGEPGIRDYIIQEHSKTKPQFILKGKFKILITINANKSIEVNSIVNTTNDCSDCVEVISKILKQMKNWNPEIKNGKAIKSNKNFILEF